MSEQIEQMKNFAKAASELQQELDEMGAGRQAQPEQRPETWAIVELIGHLELAGRLSKPDAFGGLYQLDIPTPTVENPEAVRSELFSTQAVYRIRFVTKEIAWAYGVHHEIIEWNAPVVTKEQYEQALQRSQHQLEKAEYEINELRRRLTAVNALPSGSEQPYLIDDDEEES